MDFVQDLDLLIPEDAEAPNFENDKSLVNNQEVEKLLALLYENNQKDIEENKCPKNIEDAFDGLVCDCDYPTIKADWNYSSNNTSIRFEDRNGVKYRTIPLIKIDIDNRPFVKLQVNGTENITTPLDLIYRRNTSEYCNANVS